MRAVVRRLFAVGATAALITGCASATSPSPSPTPTPTASATPTPSPTPSPTCEAFGTSYASTSSEDWSSQLRTAPGDALWGATMRVGTHGCYDRWVFEFEGTADMPGWSVTPYPASTFLGDPSGELIDPPLAGTASLDVAFAAWYDGAPIGEATYSGPRDLLTPDLPAIKEARILGGFEGISHVGIGLDRARPYRVTWLTDPARLVIDVYTG